MVFDVFAAQAQQVGRMLTQGRQLMLGAGAPVDLGKPEQVEIVLLSIRTAVKDYCRRGEDMLVLIERIGAMLSASNGARSGDGKTDAGLHVLRAIAICELLLRESAQRFSRHAPLGRLAEGTTGQLVQGLVVRFGGNLPTELQRAFPHFSRIGRQRLRPVQERHRLLPWLIKRA
jgi:hypothetical protein